MPTVWKAELKTMTEIKTKGRLSVSYDVLASRRCFQTFAFKLDLQKCTKWSMNNPSFRIKTLLAIKTVYFIIRISATQLVNKYSLCEFC